MQLPFQSRFQGQFAFDFDFFYTEKSLCGANQEIFQLNKPLNRMFNIQAKKPL